MKPSRPGTEGLREDSFARSGGHWPVAGAGQDGWTWSWSHPIPPSHPIPDGHLQPSLWDQQRNPASQLPSGHRPRTARAVRGHRQGHRAQQPPCPAAQATHAALGLPGTASIPWRGGQPWMEGRVVCGWACAGASVCVGIGGRGHPWAWAHLYTGIRGHGNPCACAPVCRGAHFRGHPCARVHPGVGSRAPACVGIRVCGHLCGRGHSFIRAFVGMESRGHAHPCVCGHLCARAPTCVVLHGHGHPCAWAPVCVVLHGHLCVWTSLCVGMDTGMCGHPRAWASACAGARTSTCVGIHGHSRARTRVCVCVATCIHVCAPVGT